MFFGVWLVLTLVQTSIYVEPFFYLFECQKFIGCSQSSIYYQFRMCLLLHQDLLFLSHQSILIIFSLIVSIRISFCNRYRSLRKMCSKSDIFRCLISISSGSNVDLLRTSSWKVINPRCIKMSTKYSHIQDHYAVEWSYFQRLSLFRTAIQWYLASNMIITPSHESCYSCKCKILRLVAILLERWQWQNSMSFICKLPIKLKNF